MHHLFPRSVPSPRLRFVGGLVRSRRAGPRLVLPALPRRVAARSSPWGRRSPAVRSSCALRRLGGRRVLQGIVHIGDLMRAKVI